MMKLAATTLDRNDIFLCLLDIWGEIANIFEIPESILVSELNRHHLPVSFHHVRQFLSQKELFVNKKVQTLGHDYYDCIKDTNLRNLPLKQKINIFFSVLHMSVNRFAMIEEGIEEQEMYCLFEKTLLLRKYYDGGVENGRRV